MARNNHDYRIKVAPMILGNASSTAPTFSTIATAASRYVDMQGWAEATVVASVKQSGVAGFSKLLIKLQESNDLVNWTDIPQDDNTNVARLFETETTTPGTLLTAGPYAGGTYYMTLLCGARHRYLQAIPTQTDQAIPYEVICVLHQPTKETLNASNIAFPNTGGTAFTQIPSGNRIVGGDGGVQVVGNG